MNLCYENRYYIGNTVCVKQSSSYSGWSVFLFNLVLNDVGSSCRKYFISLKIFQILLYYWRIMKYFNFISSPNILSKHIFTINTFFTIFQVQSITRYSLWVRQFRFDEFPRKEKEVFRNCRNPNWIEELWSPKGQAFLWHSQVRLPDLRCF